PKAEEEKADDHVWYSEIKIRAIGNESGCPICVGKKVVPSNCLAITHHHLEKQWHPTFNGDKKPEDYTAGSHEKIWWKCREDPKADDHVWYSEIKSRTRGNKSGCPICINRREWPVPSTSLKKTHPKLAKEWHPTENIYKETGHFPIGKLEDLWRPCLYDENYEWKVTINARARLLKLYSHFDDDINPFLAKEWEPTKDKKPEHFTAGSNEKIWWKCRKGHKWPALIKSRTRTDKPTGCLECNPKSKEELQIFYELKSIWKDAVNGYKEEFDSGEFDFYIPKLYLVIDYDGNRWHNKKNNIERDRTKTNIFKLNKYNVFRIREQSNEFKLDNITDNDITIDKYQKNKIKTIVDRVLSNIMEMFPNELDKSNSNIWIK
ncbi:MAG: zinc-ribbon domain-containing protein, partial [Flavobacteriales bacterium]|nr:zinc-ribbon domain-containing protein [Flavobacteriales bacterium]